MILTIIIAIISLIALIFLHELGHFLLAKKFGVKVEEFGFGYPPRIWGKKIGETLYSINLLPFGGFVRIYGQEKRIEEPRSFTVKPYWQKALIISGGVISFWIIAAIILSIVMMLGAPTVVGDSAEGVVEPKVQIIGVASESPAKEAGLKIGDIIKKVQSQKSKVKSIDRVREVQEFTNIHRGEEITLTIQRGKDVFDVFLIPRVSPPSGEGAMGISLVRTALESYPWYEAIWRGVLATGDLTWRILAGWGMLFSSLFQGKGVPAGMEVAGIVGIFQLFAQVGSLGVSYFLNFVAVITVHLAIINILPIPALDGGWLLFITIEKIRKKPLNQKVIESLSSVFFILLIILMILITIKDVMRIF